MAALGWGWGLSNSFKSQFSLVQIAVIPRLPRNSHLDGRLPENTGGREGVASRAGYEVREDLECTGKLQGEKEELERHPQSRRNK